MSKSATLRGAAWAVLVSTLAFAVAGCAAQGGSQAYDPGYGGYYSPYGNGATQSSTCGALGTCAPSNYPRIVPGDEHGD